MQKIKKIALPVVGILCLVMAFQVVALSASAFESSKLTIELNPIGTAAGYTPDDGTGLTTAIGEIINVILSFLGVVLIVLIIYAGFLWMTAGGNEEQVKKAKSWMINAIIGLIIILLAYAITSFVVTKLAGAIA